MAYFRPGNTIPDDVPLAALNNQYQKYQGEIPRPTFNDRPGDAPEFAGIPREKSNWYIFWHFESPDEHPQGGLALWKSSELPVFTREQLKAITHRETWHEIPGYQDSTPLEKRMVRAVAGLWLFEVDQEELE